MLGLFDNQSVTVSRTDDLLIDGGSAGGWRSWRCTQSMSQPAPRLCRQKQSAHLVEIGQCEHGLGASQILGQTAASDLGEAPQLLDHPKGMQAAGPSSRARPIDQPPTRAQRPLGGGTPVDPIAYAPQLKELAVVLLPIGLITEDLAFLPVQQLRQLVLAFASRALVICTMPRWSVPMCSFIPKCQFLPFLVCFISGSRVAVAFLVELGAAMMVASTMVPERSNSPRASSQPPTASKIAPVSWCCSSR
jgi:hypothetical protein